MVFAIALTPFAALHDHHHEAPVCEKNQLSCGHKFHIHESSDNCLICKAHFEKSYSIEDYDYHFYVQCKSVPVAIPTVQGTYAELISLALRGPPVA